MSRCGSLGLGRNLVGDPRLLDALTSTNVRLITHDIRAGYLVVFEWLLDLVGIRAWPVAVRWRCVWVTCVFVVLTFHSELLNGSSYVVIVSLCESCTCITANNPSPEVLRRNVPISLCHLPGSRETLKQLTCGIFPNATASKFP